MVCRTEELSGKGGYITYFALGNRFEHRHLDTRRAQKVGGMDLLSWEYRQMFFYLFFLVSLKILLPSLVALKIVLIFPFLLSYVP